MKSTDSWGALRAACEADWHGLPLRQRAKHAPLWYLQ